MKCWRKGLRKGENEGMLWTHCAAVWEQQGPAAPYRWASWGAASRVCHPSHRRQARNWAQGPSGELSQEQKEMEPQVGLEDKAAVYIVQSIQETHYLQRRSEANPGDRAGDPQLEGPKAPY